MKQDTKKLLRIPIGEIDFGQRLRSDYGNVEQLAADIKKVGGLIHPVTVTDKQKMENKTGLKSIETDSELRYLLLAGGRRVTAYKEFLEDEEITAYVFPELLTSDQIREIELMENLSRKDLDWKEQSKMVAEYDRLQRKIYGTKRTSEKDGHSMQDTADDIGVSKSSVKNAIDLSEALEAIPELAGVKTKTEALKVMREIKKSDEAEQRAKKANKKKQIGGLDKVKSDLMDSYIVGDFFERAKKLPANSFSLIEIDPPYAIDLSNVKKNSKHKTLTYNEVEAAKYEHFMTKTLAHAKRLIKPNGWLVVWYAISPWHSDMVRWIEEAGFKTNGLPAIWIKNGGQTARPKHYFGSCYEPFLYARPSEDSRLNKGGTANYLVHGKVAPEKKWHPTQRPVALMEEVIDRFISSGKILVPFAGSGATLMAAHNMNFNAKGFDLSEDYKNKYDAYIADHKTLEFKL